MRPRSRAIPSGRTTLALTALSSAALLWAALSSVPAFAKAQPPTATSQPPAVTAQPPAATPEPTTATPEPTAPTAVGAVADSIWFEPAIQRAQELQNEGKSAAAEAAARELLAQVEQRQGRESKAAARVLSLLISTLRRSEKSTAAETLELAQRALALRERVYGADHVAVAVALMDLANIHGRRGEHAEALVLTERAVALREKHLPENDRLIGEALSNLGACRFMAGDMKGALEPLERALAIIELTLGPEHPKVANCLENLATIYSVTGNPRAAVGCAERAVSIVEKAQGADHPRYAEGLVNLAGLHSETGDLERALELTDRALVVLERSKDADPSLIIAVRSNRAQQLRRMGRYAEARQTIERLLPETERLVGPDHPDVAHIHLEFGALLLTTGDFEAGAAQLERAIAITAKAEGEQSPTYAYLSVSRSAALVKLGQLDAAEAVLQQAVATLDNAGVSDRMFALALNNLADVQVRLGRPGVAVTAAERAVRMARISSPREGSQVAITLSTLGLALLDQGDAPGARVAHEQALTIRRRELGEQHPETAFSMFQLALTLADQGHADEALELALQCEQAGRAHVRLSARALSEREALLYAAERPRGVELALALLARGAVSPATAARVWDEVARSRGLVLDEMAQRNHAAHTAADPDVQALEAEFATRRQALARAMIRDADAGDLAARIEQARADVEQAERALADASAAFRARLQQDDTGLPRWLAQLELAHALVAYVRFDDPLASLAGRRAVARGAPARSAGASTYLAFVQLSPTDPPRAVTLGGADEVDALVAAWRAQMSEVPVGTGTPASTSAGAAPGAAVGAAAGGAAGGAASAGADTRAREAAVLAAGQALHARVWEPLASLVEAASTVLIVPDGELQLVDFAALPAADGTYLVERGPTLHFLSAERDLQATSAVSGASAATLLALGDPDFDTTPRVERARRASVVVASAVGSPAAAAIFRGQRPPCGDFNAIRWKRLPQTARELQDIAAQWRQGAARDRAATRPAAKLLTGKQAGEAALKSLAPGRRVVHVATHGFALEGGCVSAGGETTRGMGGYVVGRSDGSSAPGATATTSGETTPGGETTSGGETTTPASTAAFASPANRSDNPLQLCGLVLAGANQRNAVGPDQEDGIVTAEEIAALDLSSVQWAVLSACETGVGISRAGEGVFGLRRAFRIAGAHTVITSLWPVQDRAAREWMHALYEARWVRGLATAEAVRHAARSQLQARRARGESTHPRWWAGFIAAGEWR